MLTAIDFVPDDQASPAIDFQPDEAPVSAPAENRFLTRDALTGQPRAPSNIPTDEEAQTPWAQRDVAKANRFQQQLTDIQNLQAAPLVDRNTPAKTGYSLLSDAANTVAQGVGALPELADIGPRRADFASHEKAMLLAGQNVDYPEIDLKTGLPKGPSPEEVALGQVTAAHEAARQAVKGPYSAIAQPIQEEAANLKTIADAIPGNERVAKIAESVGGMLPYAAEAIIPVVGQALAVAHGGLAGYKSTLDHASEIYQSQGMDPVEARKKAANDATRAGLLSAALFEALPGAGKSAAERLIAQRLENSSPLVKAAVNTISASAQGGVVMGTMALADSAMAKWTYNPDLTWADALEEAAKSAASGAVAVGIMHAPGEALRLLRQPETPEVPPQPNIADVNLPARWQATEKGPENAVNRFNVQNSNVPRAETRENLRPNAPEVRQVEGTIPNGSDSTVPAAQGPVVVPPEVAPIPPEIADMEHPVETAFKDKNGKVWTGTAHVSVDMPAELRDSAEMGFVTSKGRFVGYDHGLALDQKHYDALEKAGIDPNTEADKEPAPPAAPATWVKHGLYRWTPITEQAKRLFGTQEGYLYSEPKKSMQLIDKEGKALSAVWTHEGKLELISDSPETLKAGKEAFETAAKEGFRVLQSGEFSKALEDLWQAFANFGKAWNWKGNDPGKTYEEYKQAGRTSGKSSDAAVKQAVSDARKNGPSPEFRSLFGGIDPELAGTTPEKVSDFAKTLGMEWRPVGKPTAPVVQEAVAPAPPLQRALEIEKTFGLNPADAHFFNVAIEAVAANSGKWSTAAEGIQKEALRAAAKAGGSFSKTGDLKLAKEVAARYIIGPREASAGPKALGVGEAEKPGPITRSGLPPAKAEEGALETPQSVSQEPPTLAQDAARYWRIQDEIKSVPPEQRVALMQKYGAELTQINNRNPKKGYAPERPSGLQKPLVLSKDDLINALAKESGPDINEGKRFALSTDYTDEAIAKIAGSDLQAAGLLVQTGLMTKTSEGLYRLNHDHYQDTIVDLRKHGFLPRPALPEPTTKEPWQMTRTEWEKLKGEAGKAEIKALKSLSRSQRQKEHLWGTLERIRLEYRVEAKPIRNRGVPIVTHESVIRKAIAEGKPVPPEVLADYPDLKPKAPEPTPGLDPKLIRTKNRLAELVSEGKGGSELAGKLRAQIAEAVEATPEEIKKRLNRGAYHDPDGVTWKVQQDQEGKFYVERTKDGVRDEVEGGFGGIKDAQDAAFQHITRTRPVVSAADVESLLSAAIPDAAEARSRVKAIDRSQAEMRDEYRKLQDQIKEIEKSIKPQRGNPYTRSKIKANAKKSDVAKYRDLQQQAAKLDQRIGALDDAAKADRALIDSEVDSKVISDKSQPLLRRLDRAFRRAQDGTDKQAQATLKKALDAETQRVILEKYPDATPEEIARLDPEVQRASYFNPDPWKQPDVPTLPTLRRGALEAALDAGVPKHLFPPELTDKLNRFTAKDRSFGNKDPIEDLSAKQLADLKQEILNTTDQIRADLKAAEERSAAEKLAENAKTAKLLDEAQTVADSAKKTGTPGGVSPKEVKTGLIARIKSVIDEVLSTAGVSIKQTDPTDNPNFFVATSTTSDVIAYGEIEPANKKFKVKAWRVSDKDNPIIVTMPTKEGAEWVLKAMAAEGKGSAVIGIPGDGVQRLWKSGQTLLKVWKGALGLDTSAGEGTVVRKEGGGEAPPESVKTVGEWAEAKRYHGLEPLDKISTWSLALKVLAERVNLKEPENVTTHDVDNFIAKKKEKPSQASPTNSPRDLSPGGLREPKFSLNENINRNARFTPARTTSELTALVQSVGRSLAARLGRGFDPARVRVVEPALSDPITRSTNGMGETARQAIEMAFGRKIVYLDLGEASQVDAVTYPKIPEYIFINVRSKKPYLMLTGHEILHHLQFSDKALYAELVEKFNPLIQDSEKFAERLNEIREEYGMDPLKDEQLASEIMGDFFGDSFTDPAFWDKLSAKEPGLFVRVARAVLRFISELAGKLKDSEAYKYVSDISKAHDVIVDSLSRWAKRNNRELPPEADPSFSLAKPEPADEERNQDVGNNTTGRNSPLHGLEPDSKVLHGTREVRREGKSGEPAGTAAELTSDQNANEGDEIQFAGEKYTVMDKGSFSPAQNAQSEARVRDLMGKTLFLPGQADTLKGTMPGATDANMVFKVRSDGMNHDSDGHKLLAELQTALETQHHVGGDASYASTLVNAISKNIAAGNFEGVFNKPLINDLFQMTASERRTRGQMLRAVTGLPEDLHAIARNTDLYLRRIYANAFGGTAIDSVLKRILKDFRNYFNEGDYREIETALTGTDAGKRLSDFLKQLYDLRRSEAGGKLYKILQGKYKPKQPLPPGALEAKSVLNEEVSKILEEMANLGLTPKERLGKKKLEPIEELRLMVQDKSIERVERDVDAAIASGERNAGLAEMIRQETKELDPEKKQALADDIALMQEDPTMMPHPDYIEQGLNNPKFSYWRTIRDNWKGYSPTSIELVRRVIKGDFKGTRFADPKVKPADTRIDLNALARSPEAEVERVLANHRENVKAQIDTAGASPETIARIEDMIHKDVADQLEKARQRVRDPMFAPPKDPAAKLTPEQAIGQKINAGLFRDPRLDISGMVERVAGKGQIKAVLPNLKDIIKQVFETPIYRQGELAKRFSDVLIEKLGVTPEQAAQVVKIFEQAFGDKFAKAKAKALAAAKESLSPTEAKVFQKRALWQKIERMVNAGGFDSGDLLRMIADEKGWKPPSDATVETMRKLAIREQELRDLNTRELAALGPDATPQQIEEARSKKEAATTYQRADLVKRVGVMWAEMSRPIPGLNPLNPVKSAKTWFTHRKNYADAINELNTFNLLAKVGFTAYRLPMHLTTQLLGHLPTRAIGRAMEIWKNDRSEGRQTTLMRDVGSALHDSAQATLLALRPALVAAHAEMLGRGQHRNVDRLLSGINALERLFEHANTYWKNGDYGRAIASHFFAWPRVMAWYVSAIDHWQGTPVEYSDIIHRVEMSMREMGRSKAEIETFKSRIFSMMKSEIAGATTEARRILDGEGVDHTEKSLHEAAWRVVRRNIYNTIERAGLPADDFEADNTILANTQSWQVPTTGGVGSWVAKPLQAMSRGVAQLGIPLPLARFTNAIATSINYSLMWTPFYKLADVGWPKNEPSTWFRTDSDRSQRLVQAALGTVLGGTALAFMAAGVFKMTPPWIMDKDERDEFERQGHKMNTIEVNMGNGKFMPFSVLVGPFTLIAPYLYGAGAVQRLFEKRAKDQARLNAEAARKGVTPGKIRPLNTLDILGIAGETAWGATLGNRSVSGLAASVQQFGTLNANKTVASAVAPSIPGLPGYQELSRAMGVTMDKNLASVWDYLVSLPTSKGRAINMLGDPVGTPDDLQRVIQTMTSGAYPGIVDPKDASKETAYKVLFDTGYRPPTINPNKCYLINGEFRPMNNDELEKYTLNRGQILKQTLSGMDGADKNAVKGAFRGVDQQALESVGAQEVSAVGVTGMGGGGAPSLTGNVPSAKTSGSTSSSASNGTSSATGTASGGSIAPRTRRLSLSGSRSTGGRLSYRAPARTGSRSRRLVMGRLRVRSVGSRRRLTYRVSQSRRGRLKVHA